MAKIQTTDSTTPMQLQRENITAIILAGGQGSRFQHRDKGLINWQKKPLVEHVIQQLAPQVGSMIISCNRNIDRYQAFGYPCVTDIIGDFQGPLAGIQAALATTNTEYCITCPCDSPVIPNSLVEILFTSLTQHKADLAYVFDGERRQYLLSFMKTTVRDSLNAYLTQQDRRVRKWHQQLNTIEVDFTELQGKFMNINSPSELNNG